MNDLNILSAFSAARDLIYFTFFGLEPHPSKLFFEI